MAIDDPFAAVAEQNPDDEPNIPKRVSAFSGAALTVAGFLGVSHLAIPTAIVGAWHKYNDRDHWKRRTQETVDLLVTAVRALAPEYERLDREQKRLSVDLADLESSVRLAILNDGATFDDRRRRRCVSAIANSTISPTHIGDLVSFIQDIDRLNDADITALKVLNTVMNKRGDWDSVRPTEAGMHPNTFIGRRQELAVQMSIALGKGGPEGRADTFSREEGLGLCLRLQGFGLAAVIDAESRSVPRTNYCARLTPRGLMLLRLLGEEVANWERYFDENGPL